MYLKIKKFLTPIFTEHGISFGFNSNCLEIDDPEEELIDMIKRLEKGIYLNRLYEESAYDGESIDGILEMLDQYNILENANDTKFDERYKTNLNYFSTTLQLF